MKPLYIVICFLFIFSDPLYAQEDDDEDDETFHTVSSFYLGVQYGDGVFVGEDFGQVFHTGVYFGFETPITKYLALLNSFGIAYLQGYQRYGDILGDKNFSGTYYAFGLRVFLGTYYAFLDLNIGFGFAVAMDRTRIFVPFYPVSATLGFNIPLGHRLDLQILGDIGMMEFPYILTLKLGLQIYF